MSLNDYGIMACMVLPCTMYHELILQNEYLGQQMMELKISLQDVELKDSDFWTFTKELGF